MDRQTKVSFKLSRSELALVGVTMLWGTTFLITRQGLTVSGPLFFVGLRFSTAALLMILVSLPVLKGLTLRELIAGLFIGVSLFAGFALQTYGLVTITASKSAFYVPAVPLLQWLVMRKRPQLMAWLGIGFAFAGLILLAGPEGTSLGFGRGELFTFLAALAFASEILCIGIFAGSVSVRRVTIIQVVVTALLSFALMPVTGEEAPSFSWLLLVCACGLGLASALIQSLMNWAQQTVSPTRATVIYAGEPVWAGVFGRMAGEVLSAGAWLGGALIVVGVLVSELRLGNRKRARR